jgi:hypothetical protein
MRTPGPLSRISNFKKKIPVPYQKVECNSISGISYAHSYLSLDRCRGVVAKHKLFTFLGLFPEVIYSRYSGYST